MRNDLKLPDAYGYSGNCMNIINFYKWVEEYKSGRAIVTYTQRAGRPIQVLTPDLDLNIPSIDTVQS